MKNLLTQWETEEKNQKTGGNMPLIYKEDSGDMLLIKSKHSGNILLIDKKLAVLEDDAKCIFLPKLTGLKGNTKCASPLKLTELVKKPSNLTRIGKEKQGNTLNLLALGDTLRKS